MVQKKDSRTGEVPEIKTKETAAEEVQKTTEKPEKKPPVVEAGDFFRHAKIRANALICAPYGTFHPGDTGIIPYCDAVEMQEDGRCTILEN